MTVTHKVTDVAANFPANVHLYTGEDIVYLMGLSFIVGSLFTIFILIVLDFMRRGQVAR